MLKVARIVTILAIGVALATLSIAFAQRYATIDYPTATAITLNGGPNPPGTSVGTYTDTSSTIPITK